MFVLTKRTIFVLFFFFFFCCNCSVERLLDNGIAAPPVLAKVGKYQTDVNGSAPCIKKYIHVTYNNKFKECVITTDEEKENKNKQKLFTQSEKNRIPVNIILMQYIDGIHAAKIEQSIPFYHTMGKNLGLFTKALYGFDHPAAHFEFGWDLSMAKPAIEEKRKLC